MSLTSEASGGGSNRYYVRDSVAGKDNFLNFTRPPPIFHSRYRPSILFLLGLIPIFGATVGIGLEVPALGIGPDVDAAAVSEFCGVGIDDALCRFSSIRSSSAAAALLHLNYAGFHGLEGC